MPGRSSRWSWLLLPAAVAAAAVAASAASTAPTGTPANPPAAAKDTSGMNRIAESYVKLVLAVGEHDANYVDAYYGPPEWKQAATAAGKRPLAELHAEGESLLARLRAIAAAGDGGAAAAPAASGTADIGTAGDGGGAAAKDDADLPALRRRYLQKQLTALVGRVDMLMGKRLSFDDESRVLYDAVAPAYGAPHFQAILDRIDRLVPGTGPLAERVEAYRRGFIIPSDRLGAVMSAAIDECRRRTAQHLTLPPGESFEVSYVKDKPWSGYNWYQGNFHSLIQVNIDLPIFIDRAVDLAGHEGYPGHHVYNALLEAHLVRQRGWQELTVYPLFSPQSLIAEGTANFGVDVVLPAAERLDFERRVLYPLAGLDPKTAATYDRLQELMRQLGYAGNEAARGIIDGTMTTAAAQDWLERYGLMSPPRAAQRLRFITAYRSYVINYNYGQDLVRRYIEGRSGTADHSARAERRWSELARLISSPRLPGDLGAVR